MPDEIVPYQNRDDIAVVSRDLSRIVQQGFRHEESNIIRVSDIYTGRYGNLGYVELNVSAMPTSVMIGGVIEIPGSLVDAMKRVKGMTGYVKEVVFNNDDFTTRPEDLEHPSLVGANLLDTKYFWHPLGYFGISPLEVASSIKDEEEGVIKFITEFEKMLDRFTSPERRPDLQKLLSLGTRKMLEAYKE